MSELIIDSNYLRKLDEHCIIGNKEQCEEEIELIVSNLWNGVGECEEWIWPFYTSYLQTNLLRPLYIYYFSLKHLKKKYNKIIIQDSTVIIDIIADYLGLDVDEKVKYHDLEYTSGRTYTFIQNDKTVFKTQMKKLYYAFKRTLHYLNGIEVLYLNAGKLNDDFKRINKAMSAFYIPLTNAPSLNIDIQSLERQVTNNMKSLKLSVPSELVIQLIHRFVFAYLPQTIKRIESYADFIAKNSVKLVIISAPQHEEHLTLLAAAKLKGVRSLVIGHGFTGSHNLFLDGYMAYQGTINSFEYQNKKVTQLPLRMNWFDKKI
jgi:hypothetical protein